MLDFVWLIPTLPLLGFLINGLGFRTIPKGAAAFIGSAVLFFSFCLVGLLFWALVNKEISPATIDYYSFLQVGDFNLNFSFLVDELSVFMMLIITGVGFLIHVYSAGYMHDDEGFVKFFAYLNLFVFFMLLLVLGSNYVIMFIGWEGVGLCSYLLIGFWFENHSYNDAAKKAFVVNRIGDLGFLIGMFLIYTTFGSLDYAAVFGAASELEPDFLGFTALTGITLLLFIGATGKSAQIPLYTWLPDAMAGPTPVSALIHAATMVTAGIYMIARSNLLYALSPVTMSIIAVVGIATAIFAATIGLLQNDIKKVLAYSTVSQLGYMFLALGVGSFTGALFHVMTHAFFKALLFLGAGSVIHAMGGEQDLRSMGGLRSKLPLTFATFLLGTLAIAGIPPFSGFFSKDEILAKTFESSLWLWIFGVLGAALTAFYMFRMFYLTFAGEFRGTEDQQHHLHESPWSMTIPLILLSALAVVGGLFNVPSVLGGHTLLKTYFDPIFSESTHLLEHTAHGISHDTEYLLMGISVGVALVSILTATYFYLIKKMVPSSDEVSKNGLYNLVYQKYYVDELYALLITKPLDMLSTFAYRVLEVMGIDRLVNGVGYVAHSGSKLVSRLQSGYIGWYVFSMVLGLALLFVLGLYVHI